MTNCYIKSVTSNHDVNETLTDHTNIAHIKKQRTTYVWKVMKSNYSPLMVWMSSTTVENSMKVSQKVI